MAEIKSFKALRPETEFVSKVNSLPYDVISRNEAAKVIKRNPDSFLKVIKPEAAVPLKKALPYGQLAARAAENLKDLIERRIMVKEQKPCLYIYQQISSSYQRTGVVVCLSTEDYEKGYIKIHEKVRVDTWQERVQHIRATRAHTGCALMIYKHDPGIEELVYQEMVTKNKIYDFISDDGLRNCCWKISQEDIIVSLRKAFQKIQSLYIADGHHRVAAAVEVTKMENRKKEKNKITDTNDNEYAHFPAVLIPQNQIRILGYHRLVKDLQRFSPDFFLDKLEKIFKIERLAKNQPFLPLKKHEFGMNLGGQWYRLFLKENSINDGKNIIDCLDISILQNLVLNPILDIKDPQKSSKIEFIGGKDALVKLTNKIRQGANIAFTLYPASVDEVMKVSDKGEIMPPKSTWVEPKLRSGIFVHLF